MSKDEVDRYLASLEEPKRSTLDALRRTILDIVPEAEQCISYERLPSGCKATDYVPTDRIIDGVDQTALFLNGDTFSRRDYVFIYTG